MPAYAGGLTMPTNAAPDLPDNSILLPNGLRANNVNPGWLVRFADRQPAHADLTCNPRKNRSRDSLSIPNCFGMPAYGQQGPLEWPYMRGPAYFDSDLAMFKNFQITERQKIQFRMSATNWLNHPLAQFGLAGMLTNTQLPEQRTYTAAIDQNAAGQHGQRVRVT